MSPAFTYSIDQVLNFALFMVVTYVELLKKSGHSQRPVSHSIHVCG